MKTTKVSLLRRARGDEQGQTMVVVVLAMFCMLGMGGLTIDLGRFYVVRSQLQNSTNAAGLAAAGSVYNTDSLGSATTAATNFVANNPIGGLQESSGYPVVTTTCLNLLMISPATCSNSGNVANAIRVTERVNMPTTFMRLFGVKALTPQATATASMQGVAQPWNVAIIMDSTGSMATTDSNCGGLTEFQCGLSGVQTLLAMTAPCGGGVTGSSCTPALANFRLSLFTFPPILTSVNGVATSSVDDELNCNGNPYTYQTYSKQPIAAPYILPIPGAVLPVDSTNNLTYLTYVQAGTGTNWNATYQITPFLSDYYDPSNTSTGGLNANSQLVEAVGYTPNSGGVHNGCLTYTFGVWGTGSGSGFGNTYFAASIYAAQSALSAESAAYPGSQNAIIFLSDGQANASDYNKNTSAYSGANTTNQYKDAIEFPEGPAVSGSLPYGSEVGPHTSGNPVPAYYTPATILPAQKTIGYDTLSSTSTATGQSRSGTAKGVYPDWYDQCQQAIVAGNYAATTDGTRVYSVAYGSESSGCGSGWTIGQTDTTLVATGPYRQPFSSASGVLPCTTMEDIASDWSYFYSDNQQTGNVNLGCTDNNHSAVSLQNIFRAISSTFTMPRLLPNNAT